MYIQSTIVTREREIQREEGSCVCTCVCEREQADQQYTIILSYSLFCMLIVKQHMSLCTCMHDEK